MAGFITMAVTPNYGWPVPVATDFVKDGYEAIADLGDAIDATVFALPSGAIVPIIPTTVSVGSGTGSFNSTTGNVTFTGATSISVNGVFSATYDKYMIFYCGGVTTGSAGANLRFRTSGTDNSGSSYSTTIGRSTSNGTFAQVQTTEAGSSVLNIQDYVVSDANYQALAKFEIVNPFQSFVTNGIVDFTVANNITTIINRRFGAFQFNATTSFDGFTIFSTSALTGTLKVMAYA
jgi:hypothetical protein